MAAYAENILPTDAAYYTLNNATLVNGALNLKAGGSAVFSASIADLPALTETMRVAVSPLNYSGELSPSLYMRVTAYTQDGYIRHLCPVTSASAGIYTAELNFSEGAYISLVVEIYSYTDVIVTLWELCPRVSEDFTTVIEGVEQSLPKLLYDYNAWPLTLDEEERTIGLITCNLLQETDLQGHFLMTYTASVAATITIRLKDNEATELSTPLIYDVSSGRGSIGIPHSYLNRKAGYHSFVVTAQISAGTATVGTRGILFTVDGGYMAERTIELGVSVGDLTIEQRAEDATPSNIWIISVETGEAFVRRRAYTTDVSGVSFEPVYALGPAKEVAIEFDGDWFLDVANSEALYRLNTYDEPFCFFTSTDNTLYVQRGGDASTKQLLDTDVSSISVCRGYKSAFDRSQDQGVICLYVKNGSAYYQQYVYDAAIGDYGWVGPYELLGVTGVVESVHVHRLNDYRIGFAVTTNADNYWFVSDRTYVNMAYKPENVQLIVDTVPSMYLGPEYEALTAEYTLRDMYTLDISFNYPVRCISPEPASWIDTESSHNDITIDDVSISDNVVTLTTSSLWHRNDVLVFHPTWQFYVNGTWVGFPYMHEVLDNIAPIYVELSERVSQNITSIDAAVQLRSSQSIQHGDFDVVTFNAKSSIEVGYKEVDKINHGTTDTIELSVVPTITVALTNVGTQPI